MSTTHPAIRTTLPHNAKWGPTMRVVDIWTEPGVRWSGDARETNAEFRSVGGELWLVRQHIDGEWVTWRRATDSDVEFAKRKWDEEGRPYPELPQ